MSNLITDPAELIEILQLDPALLEPAKAAARLFPLRVPRGFVARMERGNPEDPLLKQVLPIGAEELVVPGFTKDPLGEEPVNVLPGLLHKYPGRVLITPTSACAVHCRYCFRRTFPYDDNNPGRHGWQKVAEYIESDKNIHEVILSGGDPLAINDLMLAQFSELLARIPHVMTLRMHTRLPIVLPERLSPSFFAWVNQIPQRFVMVLHVNHPKEISDELAAAIAQFSSRATVLSQSVLLKGVNDDVGILAELSSKLFRIGVLPYYLHVLDKVEGTAHFDVDLPTALTIHQGLQCSLPGYLVPRLVREDAGMQSKTILTPYI
jgi:EF-P beta-lysylation protein EpmB